MSNATAEAPKAAASKVEFTADGRRKTLRNPQVELLTAVGEAKGGTMTRKDLADKCPGVGLSEHLGTLDGTKNKYTVGLVEQGLVKQKVEDVEGKDVVTLTITAAGRKALEKLAKTK